MSLSKEKENENKNQAKEKRINQRKNKGLNTWPLATKRIFMESLELPDYNFHFQRGGEFCNCINAIMFSENGKFSFVCNFKAGIFK